MYPETHMHIYTSMDIHTWTPELCVLTFCFKKLVICFFSIISYISFFKIKLFAEILIKQIFAESLYISLYKGN